MLTFSGKKLHQDDMKVMREVSKYTLNKFIPRCVQNKIQIKVFLVDNMKDWSGECYYIGNEDGIRKFEVTASLSRMNKRAKNPLARMKQPMKTLIHELIHVKQYANNQMFDYIDGNTKFEGKIYKKASDYQAYWDSPWEIESYGRTDGIYEMFSIEWKKRAKKA